MKEIYVGYVPPELNNLLNLEAILRTLAKVQAATLINNEDDEIVSEYPLKDITNNVIHLDYFKNIEPTKIGQTLENLQASLDALLKTSLMVKSIWSPSQNNVLINNKNNKVKFLGISPNELRPPAYDALLYIFSLSDEKFRQKHFENLIAYYFNSLTEALKLEKNEVVKKIDRKYIELQIRTLLPVVKFRVAVYLAKVKSSTLENILINISNYLKYPLINQEDVYETIRNKLSSFDYDLLSFKLIPLDAKNGHLGEYFHLMIKVNFQKKEENISLFAKFVMSKIKWMQEFIEKGFGAREDFFYSTLYPLYLDNGLESILDFAPKCYLSRISGVLILEDLGSLSYKSPKPNEVLDYGELKVMLRKLAKFHAASLILEEILSKKLEQKIRLGDMYPEYFKEIGITYDGANQAAFDSFVETLYYILGKRPDLTEHINLATTDLNAKLKDIMFSTFSKLQKSEKMRNVVNHGDLYISNMMLKFGKDRAIEDGVFIDFQVLRYIPPAYEVVFFIFMNSTKENREKHFHNLLDWYYENLSSCLKSFNLDIEPIFSRQEFDDNVKYAKSASLTSAFNYGHLTHADPDFREEVFHDQKKMEYYISGNKSHFVDLSWEQEHYRVVVGGLVEDLVDLVKN